MLKYTNRDGKLIQINEDGLSPEQIAELQSHITINQCLRRMREITRRAGKDFDARLAAEPEDGPLHQIVNQAKKTN